MRNRKPLPNENASIMITPQDAKPTGDRLDHAEGIRLYGITWDDPRGWGPLAEVGRAFAATPAGREVTVRWDIQPLDGFESRSVSELAGRYDLLNLDHPHIGQAVSTGALRPVGDIADEFLGPSLASYRWAGQVWAVPVDAACQVAAYRAGSVAAPPRSYTDVLALARQRPVAASLVGVHALMALLTLLAQHAAPLTGNPAGNWPEPHRFDPAALQLRELAAVCLPESLDWNPLQLLNAMGEGRCDYAVFTFAYINFQNDGVRFAAVPSPDGMGTRGAVLGGTGLAVSAQCLHPASALDYARFAGSADVQRSLWPRHGGQPASRAAWDTLEQTDPFYRDLRPAIENAWIRPRYAGWNERQSRAGQIVNNWLRQPNADVPSLRAELEELWIRTGMQTGTNT